MEPNSRLYPAYGYFSPYLAQGLAFCVICVGELSGEFLLHASTWRTLPRCQ